MTKKEKSIRIVFKAWNLYGRIYKAKIPSHRRLTPDIKQAIVENLKEGWIANDMRQAIRNYCLVLSSADYWWNYRWKRLAVFLTVRKDTQKKWCRFHPNNFHIGFYLTESAQRAREHKVAQDSEVEQMKPDPLRRARIKEMTDKLFNKVAPKSRTESEFQDLKQQKINQLARSK